ncbi:hypothetical protein LCGC14_0555390 [marine sediment metagenome]|uniref:4-alpha-L-fucosyltransferase glycosyl transferase group 56 n=1 Tax=marine sediment metagenome TaxID=412755 RepID=A0A0F9U9Y5_9ZZZZ
MKYLHFMMDQFYSREFIELIQSNFDIGEHQFILIKKKHKKSYTHPEKYPNIKIFTISREKKVFEFAISHIKFFTKEYLSIRKLMRQAKNIFIHNLTEEITGILFGFKGKARILWVIWGTDLYDYIPIDMYDRYTLELVDKLDNKLKSMLIRFYYSFFHAIRKIVIKRLDYVISAHQGDIRLFKKYYKTKAECISKNIYQNLVDFEKIDKDINFENEIYKFKKKGDKLLLLGNSGSPSNNHLDLMIRLSEMKKQNFKIICPLSYGPPIYINKIVEKGKILFGERFIPLLEFLAPDVYFFFLKQIDLAVMYHNRQQGMGTIHILVYLGKPICMKKTSGFFHLIKKNTHIFSVNDLEKLMLSDIGLTRAMCEHNKKIALHELYSKKSVVSSIERLFCLLDKDK